MKDILTEIKEALNPIEEEVFESMLQGDNLKETAENLAISIAYAQSCRKTIYEIVGQYTNLSNNKSKQLDLIEFVTNLKGESTLKSDSENEKLNDKILKKENEKDVFDDPYFRNLSMDAIAELAKKSIRMTSENSNLETKIEEKDARIRELEIAVDNLGFCGNFFVYNPNKEKPQKIYKDYNSACIDAKRVSKKEQDAVLVLKIMTLIVPKCTFETVDVSKKGIPEKYINDEIPF